jgi:hypothetical protein
MADAAAEPIVQQTLADTGAEHQALLDRLHGVLDGAWKWIETYLPGHALKPQVLDALKGAYDNGAQVIKEDFATLKAQGESLAATAEGDLKQDATQAVSQAETVAGSVASTVAAAVPTTAGTTSTSASSPAASADPTAK